MLDKGKGYKVDWDEGIWEYGRPAGPAIGDMGGSNLYRGANNRNNLLNVASTGQVGNMQGPAPGQGMQTPGSSAGTSAMDYWNASMGAQFGHGLNAWGGLDAYYYPYPDNPANAFSESFENWTMGETGTGIGTGSGMLEELDLFFEEWMGGTPSDPGFWQGQTQMPSFQDYVNWWDQNVNPNPSSGGGQIGGAGDLNFGGGAGMGYTSPIFQNWQANTGIPGGQDIANYFMCDGGPMYNSAGQCIACCDQESAAPSISPASSAAQPNVAGPGSGGSRTMNTPTLGAVFTGRNNMKRGY